MNKKSFMALLAMALAIVLASSSWAADPRYEKAQKLYNAGKYEETVTTLKDYIKNTPDPKAYYLIAYSLYKLGRNDEANEYFRQSYLVQPEYTPTPALEKKHKRLKNVRPEGYYNGRIEEKPPAGMAGSKPVAPEGLIAVEEKSTLALPSAPVNAPAVTNAPAVDNAVAAANAPAPAKAQPPVAQTQPQAFTPMMQPPSDKAMGLAALAVGGTILIIILAVTAGLYLFVCFCMFKIAKKLEVPAPWLAFIPIAQVFTFVKSAGKPAWWIVLLLVPLVNIVIGVYLWMLIAINLGRGKLFGIALALVPVVNIVLLAILAFSGGGPSRGGKPGKGRKGRESTGEFTPGEGDFDLPDVPSDMDFDADEFK